MTEKMNTFTSLRCSPLASLRYQRLRHTGDNLGLKSATETVNGVLECGNSFCDH